MDDVKQDVFVGGRTGVLAILAVGYFLAASAAIILLPGYETISLWFANVFAVALLLRNPDVALPVAAVTVFVAALAANLAGGNPADISLLFAATNTFGIANGTALVRWRGAWTPATPGIAAYAWTLILGGFVAPATTALLFAVLASGIYQWPFLDTFRGWVAGDAFAFAMLLPVFLYASRARLNELARGLAPLRLLAWLVACAAVAALGALLSHFPFIFATVPLAVAATRNKPFELALCCAASGAALIAAAEFGQVPVLERIPGRADGYQLAVAFMMVFPFLGGLLVEQLAQERRRIAESEQRFRRAMEDSSIGVGIVALDGRITVANKAFADMLGYSRAELEAKTFLDITHPDDFAIGKETMRKVRSGEANSYGFEKRYLHKDGTPIWARLSGSVIRDEETGAPLHLVSQIVDIDARKRAEAAIADAETRWNFTLASAGQGAWEVDLKAKREKYSPTWHAILGYTEGDLQFDPGFWLTLVHPDDRDRVAEADKAHMEGKTSHFEAEFRMRHKDGRWIWILDRGKVIERDEAGNPLRAIGTHTDITRLKEAEQRIAESAAQLADEKERLRVTLEAIGDAVICTDGNDRITFMNPMAEKLAKVDSEKAVGVPLERFYRSLDEDSGESLSPAGPLDRVRHHSRAVLVRHDGSRCSIREVISPIVTERNEYSGAVIVFQDITDARALQRELAYQASHDPLTGLANRSSFMQTMQKLLEEVRRSGDEHQLVYLDLDHFKTVNDTSGHAAGDDLLKRVTETIRRALRPGDTAARLGGDEFAIILRSCSDRSAALLAQRLVDRLHALDFTWRGKLHQVGASAGIAPIRPDAGAIDDIIARADAACYSAKAAGRGRVVGGEIRAA